MCVNDQERSEIINTDHATLAAERLERIRALVRTHRIVRVADLGRELAVSAATVRRDLEVLESGGHLRRVHGGAVDAGGRLEEPVFDDKTQTAAVEKRRIAGAALTFVGPNDSVFLDGGSTVLALAALLRDMPRLTVVTNSMRVAAALEGAGPRLIVVGGELRRLSQTFVGSLTAPLIGQLHVDTAFMGSIGVSVRHGLTTTDPGEAETKALVMSHAQRVVLMADGSKLEKLSFVKFGSLSDVDVLITDKAAPARIVRAIGRQGVEVIQG